MGIPYLFYHIVKTNSHVVLPCLNNDITNMYLDFNSIIHMCSAACISSANANISKRELYNLIYDKIISHTIDNIVSPNPPKKLLYIAIDGVAPLAKIQQQRKRRFMSAYKNKMINDWKASHNMPVSEWDSNVITPGTKFMARLNKYLKSYFEKNKYEFSVIISDSDQKGEGEHKIIQHIKHSSNSDDTNVIYGLDADLIMLSLTTTSNIFLMRESSTFEDIAKSHATFNYLNISDLRLTNPISNMRDYVALSIFLGNDFMPSVPFLKIKSGGIQLLTNVYHQVHQQLSNTLINYNKTSKKYVINNQFMTTLLEQLAAIEDSRMLQAHQEWLGYRGFRGSTNTLEDYNVWIENFPHTNRRKKYLAHTLDPNNPKWRSYYYQEIFGSNDSEFIKHITINYIKGFKWVIDYYMNDQKEPNEWFYEYGYAPSVSDVYLEYLTDDWKKGKYGKTKLTLSKETTRQLLLVIPPQTKLSNVDHLRCHSINYMSPLQFDIEIYLKNFLWECPPKLPLIDIEKINNMLSQS